jgi:hypothetical protein
MSATVHDCYELSENVSSNTLEGGWAGYRLTVMVPVTGWLETVRSCRGF